MERTAWWAPELDRLLAVAAATFDDSGRLLEANDGFLRLAALNDIVAIGGHVGGLFLQPGFQNLRSAPGDATGLIHHGLLTVGHALGATRTLRSQMWRVGDSLRLLAEHDIEELERLNETVLQLNDNYAMAQVELAQTNFKLQQREAQILEASLTDQLTGLGNRRRLEQAVVVEVERSRRTGHPLSAVMADLDHFKRVNDTYGHDAGDKVLAAFGALLRSRTRATDIATRQGGEEFVVLMPGTVLAVATEVSERLRREMACIRIEPVNGPITGSFGVAELVPGETGPSLMKRIDVALYEAKTAGRNCVVAA